MWAFPHTTRQTSLRAKMATIRHEKPYVRSVLSWRALELWLSRRFSFQLPLEQILIADGPPD